MKPQQPPLSPTLEQVFLIEGEAGLLCRILGLYASRGIEVLRADYACAAQDVMTLKVRVATRTEDDAETLRILVDKAASLIGVLAATIQSADMH